MDNEVLGYLTPLTPFLRLKVSARSRVRAPGGWMKLDGGGKNGYQQSDRRVPDRGDAGDPGDPARFPLRAGNRLQLAWLPSSLQTASSAGRCHPRPSF